MNKTKVLIVTPVYEDVESARLLFRDLKECVSDLRIVAVDDGSVYYPIEGEVLESLGMKGAVITLRRNLGHQGAIAVGLCYVHACMQDYDCVIVMDSDGEDTPESVRELLQGFIDSKSDVRVAERKRRNESFKFIQFYRVYKFIFRMLTGKTINFGNFMVLKPRAVSRLSAMNEIWIHLAASVIASRLRVEGCKIDRGVRYVGNSKMNFVSLVLHGFKGVMVFSEQVLIRMGGASLVVAITSVLVIFFAILLKLIDAASPGWFSTVIGSTVVIFLQTGVLTLITLMITGLVRVSTLNQIDFNSFIDHVKEVR
ncbi:MAG TPA: glycosyltransferase [Methylotenera sp.]|nr:glycosyltransferase [Methylotenera sp.]